MKYADASCNVLHLPSFSMLHHLSFAVSNLERSGSFYDAVFSPLGYVRVWEDDRAIGYGRAGSGDRFAIKLQMAGVAIPGEGFHVAFAASNRRSVTAFYNAAILNGGADNGGVGLHPEYGHDYFAAFVFDPDGYRIEAVIDLG